MQPTLNPPVSPPEPAPVPPPSSSWRGKLAIAFFVVAATMLGGILVFSFMNPPSPQPTKTAPPPAKKTVVKPAIAPAPTQASPAQPAPAVQTPTGSRINVEVSTPAGSRVKVDVEEGTAVAPPPIVSAPAAPQPVVMPPVPTPETIINIYPPAPAPAQPAPSVQAPAPIPAPMPTPLPPPIQPQAQPQMRPLAPAPVSPQAISAPAPGRAVNILSGNTFQLRVEILSGNGSYNGSARYGYGSTYGWTPGHEELRYDPRTGTYYRVWVAHPQPGY